MDCRFLGVLQRTTGRFTETRCPDRDVSRRLRKPQVERFFNGLLGARRFLVCVPDLGDIYIYIFAGRMDATLSNLRSERFPGVSDTCQDAIFEACTELTHRLRSALLAQTYRTTVGAAQRKIHTAIEDFETLSTTVDQVETNLQTTLAPAATAEDKMRSEEAISKVVTEMKVLMSGAIKSLQEAIVRFQEAMRDLRE